MSEMDTMDKIFAAFAIAAVVAFASLVVGFFIFSTIEAKNKDRELSIREREIELKAEQYPYKNEMKLEVTHD
jgi:hypothetical protein